MSDINVRNWKAGVYSGGGPKPSCTLQVTGEVELPAGYPALFLFTTVFGEPAIRLNLAPLDWPDGAAADADAMEWYKVGTYVSGVVGPRPSQVNIVYQDYIIAVVQVEDAG